MTPGELDTMDQNLAAVSEELDALVEHWRDLRTRHDPAAAMTWLSQTLINSRPASDDLLRLVSLAVVRLAEGGVSS